MPGSPGFPIFSESIASLKSPRRENVIHRDAIVAARMRGQTTNSDSLSKKKPLDKKGSLHFLKRSCTILSLLLRIAIDLAPLLLLLKANCQIL